MVIGTVVEGPTDRLLLEAVLQRVLPDDPQGHRFLSLQPRPNLGETGAGWKGVRRWCTQVHGEAGLGLEWIMSGAAGPQLDLLVIHVDADVAHEQDLQDVDAGGGADVAQPCPPITPTIERLAQVLISWLGRSALPAGVVLAIPAQDTENWTFAALNPDDDLCAQDEYECCHSGRQWPAYLLTLSEYGKVLRRSSGRVRKPVRRYRQVVADVAAGWNDVCRVCSQAQKFTDDVAASIAC